MSTTGRLWETHLLLKSQLIDFVRSPSRKAGGNIMNRPTRCKNLGLSYLAPTP